MKKIIVGAAVSCTLVSAALAASLTAYTTEWQIYGNGSAYPGYLYDGSYDGDGAYSASAATVSNPDMVAQLNKVDIVPFSFLQAWNSQDPNQAQYLNAGGIGNKWDGVLHFSDLYGDLISPTHTKDQSGDTALCKKFLSVSVNGSPTYPSCAAVQLDWASGSNRLFQYTDNPWVGGRGSFDAFMNSTKYSNTKRIIAIGGANTVENHSVSDYTYRAIFANTSLFINSLASWRTAFPALAGVDFDFEPPIDASGAQKPIDASTVQDYKNLLALITATRARMGAGFYISLTITPNLDFLAAIKDAVDDPSKGNWYQQIYSQVDALNVMTYDLHGAWSTSADPRTAIHTYLVQPNYVGVADGFGITYGAVDVINAVIGYGFRANKLQLGLASYGRAFGGVEANGGILGLPGFNSSWSYAPSIYDLGTQYTTETGYMPYKSIPSLIAKEGYFSENVTDLSTLTVAGTYVYNPTAKIFIGYEGPEEVVAACKLVKDKGLKGAILWSVDADLPVSNPSSLITTYRNSGC